MQNLNLLWVICCIMHINSNYVFIIGMRSSQRIAQAIDVQFVRKDEFNSQYQILTKNFGRLKLSKTNFLSKHKIYNVMW